MRTVIEFEGKTLTIEGTDFKGNHKETYRYVLQVCASLVNLSSSDRDLFYSLITWQYILACKAFGVAEEYIRVNDLKTMVIR